MKPERCNYCIPESKTIVDCVGGYMTDEELEAVINGVLAMGRILHCGDEKETCLPLLHFQKEITRRKDVGKP